MKTIQKLEICAGIATVTTVLLFIFFAGLLDIIKKNQDLNEAIKEELFWSVFILIIPAFLTAFGSYFHASKQSRLGLAGLFIGAGVLLLYFSVIFFSGGAFYYYGKIGGFLCIIPAVFAALTIYFALQSKKFSSSLA
jgi:hypothetical protein